MARPPFPRNLGEFQRAFATEEACEDYLALCRWPDGFRCPRCGGEHAYRLARQRRWQCAGPSCRHQVSLTSGTILDNTKAPLNAWFWAATSWRPTRAACPRRCSATPGSTIRTDKMRGFDGLTAILGTGRGPRPLSLVRGAGDLPQFPSGRRRPLMRHTRLAKLWPRNACRMIGVMDFKDLHERLGLPPMSPVHSADEIASWNERVSAFKASRHSEPREPDGEPYGDTGWSRPGALPSERLVLSIYGSHLLFEVTDPPGWGYRLVNLVVDGKALVWEMPGYSLGEAEKISTLLVDDYL